MNYRFAIGAYVQATEDLVAADGSTIAAGSIGRVDDRSGLAGVPLYEVSFPNPRGFDREAPAFERQLRASRRDPVAAIGA